MTKKETLEKYLRARNKPAEITEQTDNTFTTLNGNKYTVYTVSEFKELVKLKIVELLGNSEWLQKHLTEDDISTLLSSYVYEFEPEETFVFNFIKEHIEDMMDYLKTLIPTPTFKYTRFEDEESFVAVHMLGIITTDELIHNEEQNTWSFSKSMYTDADFINRFKLGFTIFCDWYSITDYIWNNYRALLAEFVARMFQEDDNINFGDLLEDLTTHQYVFEHLELEDFVDEYEERYERVDVYVIYRH